MSDIEIYSTDVCPYCVRAKNLLESKGAKYAEYNISKDHDKMAEMLKRSGGRRTVPQIFIAGQHIGGSDDLAALDAEGKLDELLESLS
ncbi:MAG: glutaredoxin 3 [bacterium]|nr:glutaredoxin 3 [bacterium]